MNARNQKIVGAVIGAVILFTFAHMVAVIGDAGAIGGGPSSLTFKVLGPGLQTAGAGCVLYAVIAVIRGMTSDGVVVAKGKTGHARAAAAIAAVEAEPAFDADAVMARYLATRPGGAPVAATDAAPSGEPAPDPRSFGRKRG